MKIAQNLKKRPQSREIVSHPRLASGAGNVHQVPRSHVPWKFSVPHGSKAMGSGVSQSWKDNAGEYSVSNDAAAFSRTEDTAGSHVCGNYYFLVIALMEEDITDLAIQKTVPVTSSKTWMRPFPS